MNPMPTSTTDPAASPILTRACDQCGQSDLYEPQIILGMDFLAGFPFYCHTCTQEREAKEKETQQQAAIAAMKATWETTVPELYRNTDIHHKTFNLAVWNGIRNHDWARQGLGLIGGPGRCKTRILALLAKRAIYAGKRVAWINTFDIESTYAARSRPGSGAEAVRMLRSWEQAALLVIDDLGKAPFTPSFASGLYNLIEARYAANRVTHWSLNPIPMDLMEISSTSRIPNEVIANALDPDGIARNRHLLAPIVSRLRETTKFVLLK